jgi:hypothetical protein
MLLSLYFVKYQKIIQMEDLKKKIYYLNFDEILDSG